MKKNYIILCITMIFTLLISGCGKVKSTSRNTANNDTTSTIEEITKSKTNSTTLNTVETDIANSDDANNEANLNNENSTDTENIQTSSKINADSQQALEDLSNILDDLDNTLHNINDSAETESLINNSLN